MLPILQKTFTIHCVKNRWSSKRPVESGAHLFGKSMKKKVNNILGKGSISAAAFIMATSAVGPGFLTQTAVFTQNLMASFGFVILVSILLDIGAQLNIWKVLSAAGMRAQELANRIFPGAGYLLTLMIVFGGLAFNTGNLAGAGLGMNVLTGWPVETGAMISAGIALVVFLNKESLQWMDGLSKVLGTTMILLTLYVVFVAAPPVGEAVKKSLVPDRIDVVAVITLVGGTVGGYISFAGAHRLIDAGMVGAEHSKAVGRAAVSAILLASLMRVLLFLAALGVVSKGIALNSSNPAAAVFEQAAGKTGYMIFGIIMWSAAITSVVGSAYTSISFFRSLHPVFERKEKTMLVAFVLIALGTFILVGKPVKTLVFAGALNGFILPIALLLILIASSRKDIVGNYKHAWMLKAMGAAVIIATGYLSIATIRTLL
jgi:Mn2+/Fe2+ NRAMP family transporter